MMAVYKPSPGGKVPPKGADEGWRATEVQNKPDTKQKPLDFRPAPLISLRHTAATASPRGCARRRVSERNRPKGPS